jgi:hypothetical protein
LLEELASSGIMQAILRPDDHNFVQVYLIVQGLKLLLLYLNDSKDGRTQFANAKNMAITAPL